MTRGLVVFLLLVASGCGSPETPTAPASGAAGAPQDALDACYLGDVPAGLAAVERAAEGGDVDALTARALCRWMAFGADSSRADARAGLADLDRAIERADTTAATPLDHLYAHRAAFRRAADPADAAPVLADLDAAVRLAPASARHLLDRAFVHLARADSGAAISDLERVLLVDAEDTARVELARQTLGELTGADLTRFYRDQETVVFE